MRALRLLVLALFAVVLVACGGDKKEAKPAPKGPSFDDAFALLPADPILLGTVDAKAFFASQTFGAQLTQNVERLVPIGKEAGFDAARDVDRVTFASYSYSGLDVAAVVIGRFDAAKIKAAATNGTTTQAGIPLVLSQYADRDVYTVNNAGFTILTDRVAIAGTETGIRRVLDRIKDDRVKRDLPQWMLNHVESQSASMAVAADLATHPIPPEVTRQVPLAFAQQLKAIRGLVTFKENGLELVQSLTFPDEAQAQAAQGPVKDAMNFSRFLALIGVKIQNPTVTVDKSDVQISFAVDDQSLKQLLATVPQLTGALTGAGASGTAR